MMEVSDENLDTEIEDLAERVAAEKKNIKGRKKAASPGVSPSVDYLTEENCNGSDGTDSEEEEAKRALNQQ
ncbi:Hypothetical predicted protein [Cloeon dipterum]|uniref:Uncharacterized protein n=1 Tax=Cloeon dipterum TaxID=197152 RepID=A0A8S1E2N5_9INSE|nr:Hypothetical predicted protein [Cloeon dipterum]